MARFNALLSTDSRRSGQRFVYTNQTSSRSTGVYEPSRVDFLYSFYAVLNRWMSETTFVSNPDAKTAHPSFRAIVENGELVVPLIIEELRGNPSPLVWALDDIIGEQPYPPDAAGDIVAMTDAWIAWAENDGRTI